MKWYNIKMQNSKFKIQNLQKGFTLVEMLVVVAVIAMISSFVMASYTQAKARSRDAKREADIKQIQEGLAIYSTAYHRYPLSCTSDCSNPACTQGTIPLNGSSDCLSAQILPSGAMIAVPMDPLRGSGPCPPAAGNQVYCYQSSGQSYTLSYFLETNSIIGKASGLWTAQP